MTGLSRFLNLITLSLLFFLSATAYSESSGKKYSLNDCIEMALKKNPQLLASKEQVQKSYFKIGEAKSEFFPSFDLNFNYQRDYQEARAGGEYFNSYSGTLSLSQTIFDFGRTSKRVKVQEELFKASEWQNRETTAEIVYNVKEAYFNLLKAKKEKETALEVLKQAQKHLDLAKGFYEVGLKPKIEVTKAEVELSNAKLALISAEKNEKEAMLSLKVAIGIVDLDDFDIFEGEYEIKALTEEEALKISLDKNPQLQAIRLNRQSSLYSEEFFKSEYLPKLSGSLRAGLKGEEFPLDRGWSFLLQLNIPLFSGWSTTYKLKQAKADTAYYTHAEESLRQQIQSQIRKLYVKLRETSQRIETLKLALKQAKENLDLAMGRYEVGVGTSIEVVDAIVLFEQTNTKYWQAVYEHKVVYASIEKILGAEK